LISNEAPVSLSQAIDLFSFPTTFRAPLLFQYNEVSEKWSTTADKPVLIQNKAALRTSITPNYISCSSVLPFVQSARCGRLVNRGESKDDALNLQISEKQKSEKRKTAIIQQAQESIGIIEASTI